MKITFTTFLLFISLISFSQDWDQSKHIVPSSGYLELYPMSISQYRDREYNNLLMSSEEQRKFKYYARVQINLRKIEIQILEKETNQVKKLIASPLDMKKSDLSKDIYRSNKSIEYISEISTEKATYSASSLGILGTSIFISYRTKDSNGNPEWYAFTMMLRD